MKRSMLAGAFLLWAAVAPTLAEPEKLKPEPLALTLPTSTPACLAMLEAVVERAADADMLDDQVDQAEEELERMEGHCSEQRFAGALEAAKAVMALVAANK